MVEGHAVSHFKALVIFYQEPEDQDCCSFFSICTTCLKMGVFTVFLEINGLPFFIDDKKVYFCGHKSLIFVTMASLATKRLFLTSGKCFLKVSTILILKNQRFA